MKKHFLTGLVILLPLVVTIEVAIFLINLLTAPFVGAVSSLLDNLNFVTSSFLFLSREELTLYISKALILILVFFTTVGLGFLARWVLTKSLLQLGDKILHKIPLVNKVYKTTQEIINNLFSPDQNSLKEVVLLKFPHNKCFVLGLVAKDAPSTCSSTSKEDLVSVYIPTTPNPTSGFLTLYKRADLIPVPIKADAAIKYIVSCGVTAPKESP